MRLKFLYLVLIAVLLNVSGCSEAVEPVEGTSLKYTVASQEDLGLVMDAFAKLMDQCTYLSENRGWLDVVEAKASISDAYPYQEDRGWKRQIKFTIVIKDNPEHIPQRFNAGRHHCYYAINAELTELDIPKEPCMNLCNETEQRQGYNLFVSLGTKR